MIVTNTTISRPEYIKNKNIKEEGGLSGKPLTELSTEVIRDMYRYTNGKVPIIGVGGIMNSNDAYDKIKAGASVIQIYTGLVYNGPGILPKMIDELSNMLIKDGYKNVSEAVGANVKISIDNH